MFRYLKPRPQEVQRTPVLPHKMISGGIPGSTVLRIGNDSGIKISGPERAIAISDLDGNTIKLGVMENGNLGLNVVNADGKETVRFGKMPDGTWGIAGANEGYSVEDGDW